MNYITTNIRIPEEDYVRLKMEAARQRKSLSGVIREKIQKRKVHKKSSQKFLQELRKLAKGNSKYLKGVDGVQIIREMRDNAKW